MKKQIYTNLVFLLITSTLSFIVIILDFLFPTNISFSLIVFFVWVFLVVFSVFNILDDTSD